MGAVVRIAVAEEVALLSFPKKPVNMISRLLCVALLSSVAVAAPQYYYPQHFAQQQQLVLPQQLLHLQYPQQFQPPMRSVFLVQPPLFQFQQSAVVPVGSADAAVNPEEVMEEEVSAETRDNMDKEVTDDAEKMDKDYPMDKE